MSISSPAYVRLHDTYAILQAPRTWKPSLARRSLSKKVRILFTLILPQIDRVRRSE